MASVTDVYNILASYGDAQGYSEEQLTQCAEKGLQWVTARLKDGTDETDPLIAETAAVIAHYFFFVRHLCDSDKYESYKAGDMAISRDLKKELQFEQEVRAEAIAAAAHLLKDGGFCFVGS